MIFFLQFQPRQIALIISSLEINFILILTNITMYFAVKVNMVAMKHCIKFQQQSFDNYFSYHRQRMHMYVPVYTNQDLIRFTLHKHSYKFDSC